MNKDYLKNFHLNFYKELQIHVQRHKIPYSIKKYDKDEVIFNSGNRCDRIGIVLEGKLNIKHILNDGKVITINTLNKYDIFGEILLFSINQTYPYHIISDDCEIMFLSKDNLLFVLKNEVLLLEYYLYHISESYMSLNKYIKLKTQKNLTNKLAYYFIYYGHITDDKTACPIKTKTSLAEFIGVERESLIRELNNLKQKEKLTYDQKTIYIKDVAYFKQLIE